jgi:methionine sulfoxide reductase heme-binding subunit
MTALQAGALATAVGPHIYWITSRAAGIAALVLASLSVCAGLLIGGRLHRRAGPDLRVGHEALSLATLAALAVHGLTLLGDGYLHPSLGDIAVPFLSGYRTVWTSMGIVAFWALLALGLSYYARARIGVQRWRRLHRLAVLAWMLGLAHSLGEGTDSGQAWFLAMIAIVALPAIGLALVRVLGSPGPPQASAGGSLALAGSRRRAAQRRSRSDITSNPAALRR